MTTEKTPNTLQEFAELLHKVGLSGDQGYLLITYDKKEEHTHSMIAISGKAHLLEQSIKAGMKQDPSFKQLMKYIELPILWKDGDAAMLEELGIDTPYEEADTKDVYLREDEIKGFFPDKNPNFTCLYLSNTEMVVNMPIDKFIKLIETYGGSK